MKRLRKGGRALASVFCSSRPTTGGRITFRSVPRMRVAMGGVKMEQWGTYRSIESLSPSRVISPRVNDVTKNPEIIKLAIRIPRVFHELQFPSRIAVDKDLDYFGYRKYCMRIHREVRTILRRTNHEPIGNPPPCSAQLGTCSRLGQPSAWAVLHQYGHKRG